MSLQKQITDDWKSSIKNKELSRKKVLTFIRAKLQEKAKATKVDLLSDENAIMVIRKMYKEQKEFVDNYGGEDATNELAIIDSYLPKLMSEDEVAEKVFMAIAHYCHSNICSAIGHKTEPCHICGAMAPTVKDMGKIMGALMKDLKGKADGTLVRNLVQKALS